MFRFACWVSVFLFQHLFPPLLLAENETMFLQWPVGKYTGSFASLGSPQSFGGNLEFHSGLDIAVHEGIPVMSPMDADAVIYFLMEDYNIHLINHRLMKTVVINHMDKRELPSFLTNVPERQITPLNIKRGTQIGIVDGGYGGYRNHIHLAMRDLRRPSVLLDPAEYFSEMSMADRTPPQIQNVFIKYSSSEAPDRLSGKQHALRDETFEILVEASDVKTNGLKTKFLRLGETDRDKVKVIDLHLRPQLVEIFLNSQLIKRINFREMPGECTDTNGCHLLEVTMDPKEIFYVDEEHVNFSSLFSSFYVPIDADDVEDADLGDPSFQRRYIFRSGAVGKNFLQEGSNELRVIVRDAGKNETTVVKHLIR